MIVWYSEQNKVAVADLLKDFTLQDMYDVTNNGETCGLILADGMVSGTERYED